jgi:hypothetical protein
MCTSEIQRASFSEKLTKRVFVTYINRTHNKEVISVREIHLQNYGADFVEIVLEIDIRIDGCEIPRLLWNPKVHYHVDKNMPLDPSHFNLVSISHYIYLRSILILFSHKILRFLSSLLLNLPTEIVYAHTTSPNRTMCPPFHPP